MENQRGNKLVPVLVLLLIVASFLIGSMYTKVQMYEKGTAAAVNNGAVAGDINGGAQPQAPAAPTGPVEIDISNAPMLGNKDAKVAIVEFTDYQCPFCKQLFENSFSQVKKEYIDTGKVKFYSRDFPLTQIHPQAQKAAEAASCAKDQNKFWEYHDTLFAKQEALQIADLKKYAVDLGLNTSQFDSCLDSNKYADKIKKDEQEGVTAGVAGTPASFIGTVKGNTLTGVQLSGAVPFANFKTALDAELAK